MSAASIRERPERGPSAPPVSGFNHYSTSDKRTGVETRIETPFELSQRFNEGLYVIDRTESRNRRMRSGVITAARLLHEQALAHGSRCNVVFLTLTYARVDGWRPDHFSAFAKHLREWCKRRGCTFRYVFKSELQKRGAVHYHLIVWLPKGVTLPKPDKQGWWKHGHTRVERVIKNAVAYIAKYAAKIDSSRPFPRGLRLHGSGGLIGHHLAEKRWWALPTWARNEFSIDDRAKRVTGGGLVSRETGYYKASPYVVVSQSQGKIVVMLRDPVQVH